MKNAETSIHATGLTIEELEGVGNKFHQGLTKREYFAAMAMQGLLSGSLGVAIHSAINGNDNQMAKRALDFADELLEALEEQ